MTKKVKRYGPETPKIMRTGHKEAIKILVTALEGLVGEEKADDLRGTGIRDETELRRSQCVQMLGAFEAFLRQAGHPEVVPDALGKLMNALNGAEDGINNNLLIPRRHEGRPPVPSDILGIRGRVAAVQGFLMENGWKEKPAAIFVFRALGSEAVATLRAQSDHRQPTWNTVNRWRTAVFEGSKPDTMGRGFEAMKKILADQDTGGDPKPPAKQIL